MASSKYTYCQTTGDGKWQKCGNFLRENHPINRHRHSPSPEENPVIINPCTCSWKLALQNFSRIFCNSFFFLKFWASKKANWRPMLIMRALVFALQMHCMCLTWCNATSMHNHDTRSVTDVRVWPDTMQTQCTTMTHMFSQRCIACVWPNKMQPQCTTVTHAFSHRCIASLWPDAMQTQCITMTNTFSHSLAIWK